MQPNQGVDDILRQLPRELQNEVLQYLSPVDQAAASVHIADGTPGFIPAARDYLATAGDDAFYDWIDSLAVDDDQRRTILSDGPLCGVFERVQRQRLLAGGVAPAVDPRVLRRQQVAAQFTAAANAIAVAAAAFEGDESEDDVQAIAAAYPAFMELVSEFQQIATADQDQERAAVAAYNAGAAVGPLIAVYLESVQHDDHDERQRQELKNGIALMCQRAAEAEAVADHPDPVAGAGAVAMHIAEY